MAKVLLIAPTCDGTDVGEAWVAYQWAKGLRAELASAARDAALRSLARAQPDFADASPAEKVSRLAALTGASSEEARRFLAAGGAVNGADFIRLAHQAQRTHAALEKGKK